jgi:hypothetical protein
MVVSCALRRKVSGKAFQTFDEERHRAGTGSIGVAMDAHMVSRTTGSGPMQCPDCSISNQHRSLLPNDPSASVVRRQWVVYYGLVLAGPTRGQ